MATTAPVVAAPAPASAMPRQSGVTYGVLITSHKAYRLPASGAYFKDGPGGTRRLPDLRNAPAVRSDCRGIPP